MRDGIPQLVSTVLWLVGVFFLFLPSIRFFSFCCLCVRTSTSSSSSSGVATTFTAQKNAALRQQTGVIALFYCTLFQLYSHAVCAPKTSFAVAGVSKDLTEPHASKHEFGY